MDLGLSWVVEAIKLYGFALTMGWVGYPAAMLNAVDLWDGGGRCGRAGGALLELVQWIWDQVSRNIGILEFCSTVAATNM